MRIDESRTAVKYTPGRQGRKIVDIVIHWWGADGQTHDGVVDWFCNPAKGAQTAYRAMASIDKKIAAAKVDLDALYTNAFAKKANTKYPKS